MHDISIFHEAYTCLVVLSSFSFGSSYSPLVIPLLLHFFQCGHHPWLSPVRLLFYFSWWPLFVQDLFFILIMILEPHLQAPLSLPYLGFKPLWNCDRKYLKPGMIKPKFIVFTLKGFPIISLCLSLTPPPIQSWSVAILLSSPRSPLLGSMHTFLSHWTQKAKSSSRHFRHSDIPTPTTTGIEAALTTKLPGILWLISLLWTLLLVY